ncbi:hypothetical protein MA16_Dca015977 [Dendrobium catenatum]|uniref:Uncharacterized protein n=1 Tax=Dendrobium catenatum TaxID=906689 RepID=A0A2I0VV02_9ASPA|nr:hypothetical protein MA16_Dca015977 [Dendrobium catenatum]
MMRQWQELVLAFNDVATAAQPSRDVRHQPPPNQRPLLDSIKAIRPQNPGPVHHESAHAFLKVLISKCACCSNIESFPHVFLNVAEIMVRKRFVDIFNLAISEFQNDAEMFSMWKIFNSI